MGQYRSMFEPTPGDVELVLDPRGIQTLDELGRQLRALRLAAPRADPADDPLTLRDLAKRTGIPRSTLGNAESGRVLPRTEVVYKVALACGTLADDIAAWTSARNRVARWRERLPRQHPDLEDVVAEADPRGDASPTREVIDSAMVLDQLRGLNPAAAGGLLQGLSPYGVAKCLGMVQAALAASYLAEMEPSFAAACLALLPPAWAAGCLSGVDPVLAQQLLRLEESALSVTHLRLMQPTAAAAAIAGMPVTAAAERLNRLPGVVASRIVRDVPPDVQTALVLAGELPERLIVELLFSLDYRRTVLLLDAAPIPWAAELLAMMPADPAAGVFAALPRRRRLALLAEVDPTVGGRLLSEAPSDIGADAVTSLPTEFIGVLLTETARTKAALLLDLLLQDRKDAILATMQPDAATAVRDRLRAISFMHASAMLAEVDRATGSAATGPV